MLVLDDEPGMLALGVQGVGEDDRAVQVQVLEQRANAGISLLLALICCWAMAGPRRR